MDNYSKAIEAWYQRPPGNWLQRLEQAQLSRLLTKATGTVLLQLGGPNNFLPPAANTFRYRLHGSAGQSLVPGPRLVSTNFNELPFLTERIDVVVMVHVIEFIDQPQQLLAQIYNTLVPGGQLILLAFNPYSCWGAMRLFGRRLAPVASGKFWSPKRLQNMAKKTGLQLRFHETFCFRPPFKSPPNQKLTAFGEAMGQLCCPGLGAVALIQFEKEALTGITQTSAAWHRETVLSNGAVEPTMRS